MDLIDIELKNVDWIDLEKNREKQRAFVETVMNNRVEICFTS
jgi:hypothetical protein